MTNRDKLYKLCTYDLLLKINNGLRKIDGGDVCVLDALNGHYVHSLHCVDKSCDKCILEYLDEECDAD